MCKATDPDAVLSIKVGDVKKRIVSNFSLKKRLFAFPKAEFLLFLEKIKRIIFIACQKANVKMQKLYFFKTIKHKTINRFFSKFVDRNIRGYNDVVHYMNEVISNLTDAIWSPAKYYQDKDLILAFNSLFNKCRQRFKKHSYTHYLGYRKIKISMSVFNRSDRFKENIESFLDQFEEDIQQFYDTYITC